jgi:DNA-binding transcriptional ArsR family regulator
MISFVLGVEDLADTRFALSPLHETLHSLRVLKDPGLAALHLPWRSSVLAALDRAEADARADADANVSVDADVRADQPPAALDVPLALSLVGARRFLPDFLTPSPRTFAPSFAAQIDEVARTPLDRVRQDLRLTHFPDPLPESLAAAADGSTAEVAALLERICVLLQRYWRLAIEPHWPRMRTLLEADMTYRARRLALGGARALFADMHPNLHWHDGELRISKMIASHRVAAHGRGLLLIPSVFAHKPSPPLSPDEPPQLVYPSRGVATLWGGGSPSPSSAPTLTALLGAPRAALLQVLAEPLPTVELARRLSVTPSAISQHLRVLYAAGLLHRARDGRLVLYRRSPLGDQLLGTPAAPG